MIEVNNDFKLKSKKVRQQDVKVTVGNERYKIKQLVYSFDGALFKTIMKQVEITGNTANQLKDKDINFKYGLYINNAFQYVDLGNFYIKDMEDDKKKEEITVTGYDRMIRFMKTFKQSELQLAYPSTIITLVKRMCKICEMELYSTNFFNSDLVVNEDFFTAQELTYRDVLEKIAQVTLTTAFIKENKLYFCKPSNVVSQQLDKSYISDLVVKEKFGPLNALVLGRGSVEDNVESIDEESITQNGRCEIRFDENEFVQEQRETVIDNMFEQIKGLEYYSYEASDLGVMWLEPCDCIELGDRNDNFYKTFYLKANITINTGITNDSEADIPDETNTEYKVTTKEEKKTLRVERLAKKNEGMIEDVIKEQTKQSSKIAEVTHTINEITQRIENIEDFTREQTETNQIHLSDTIAGSGYITNFKIYGDTEYFKYLAPSNNLSSSDNLVPLGDHFTLVLDTQGRAEKSKNAIEIDILLGEPLRNIEEVRDYLSIDGNIVSVTRKIGVNESNELYELEKPTYEEIGKLELPSFDENTYIYVDEYYNLNYYAKYIIKNAYSETYATKVELKSAISETEKNVNISVDEKLEKYSTTEETKGMIDVSSKQLTLEVSKKVDIDELEKYSTTEETKGMIDLTADEFSVEVSKKIGKEEVVSSINQTSDKIALKGNRISIKSNYFELTEEGKIVAISGKIGGFELETEKFSGNLNGVYSFDLQDVCLLLNYLNDNTSLTSELKNIYDVNNDGTLDILDVVTMLNILKGKTENTKNVKGTIVFNSKDPKNAISIKDQYGNILSSFSVFGINTENISARRVQIGQFETANDNKFVGISLDSEKNLVNVTNGTNSSKIEPTKMQSQAFNNNSLEELKKNIEKQENVMDIVKNSEIYKFNYKDENNDDKKHIGFIIGKKYKTPEELLNKEKNAIDIYSMASINWKCTQEILEELKNTKEELEELKKEVAKK